MGTEDGDARRPATTPVRQHRPGPTVPVVLLAGAIVMLSQIDAFASFAAVFWLAGLATLLLALVIAWRDVRNGRRRRVPPASR